MNVIIENTVALNTGDAAILVAIIDIVRETFGAQTHIAVFDGAPDVAASYYPDIEFHPLTSSFFSGRIRLFGRTRKTPARRLLARLQRAAFARAVDATLSGRAVRPSVLLDRKAAENLALYAAADLVISTGGTYLVEHYKLRNRFEELHKDLRLRKPLVLFTQSLGPFHDPSNRDHMKRIADAALLVLLRDAKSAQHLRDVGVVHDRLAVVSDSVFALARLERLRALPPRRTGARLRVAVSVRRWTHYEGRNTATGTEQYESAVAAAVTELVRAKGAEVVFISTCQGIPEYLYDDSEIASRICERLDPTVRSAVSVDAAFHGPHALMDRLCEFDFAISTRMHLAILSLCVGVPVLPISYEFKTTELFTALGQRDWITDISAIEPEPFAALALRFSGHFGQCRDQLAPQVIEQSRSARSAGRLIAEMLENRTASPDAR